MPTFSRVELNKKNNSDNTEKFLEYGIDINNRTIHIAYEIDPASTSLVKAGIQLMIARTREKPIDIYINSMGGCPYSGLGLYSFIRALYDVQVNTYNTGSVMSAASIIFLAGDNRYMLKYTTFMLHTVSSGVIGKIFPDIDDEAEECKRLHKDICEVYAKHTSKTRKQWDNLIKYKDRYYRYEDALKIGIVHKVIEKI